MNILMIDAQGGGMGRQLVASVKKEFPQTEITAVGTNSLATSNMLKAGADHAATGENAVIVGCRKADLIIGPIGIAIADSMFGEITPAMAAATPRDVIAPSSKSAPKNPAAAPIPRAIFIRRQLWR